MKFTNYGFQLLFVQGLGFKLGFSRGLELRGLFRVYLGSPKPQTLNPK